MHQVNTIGMVLYLILAVFGGFLTGLFSRYAYDAALKEFGKLIALLLGTVFYVVPAWAFFSLFKEDDLDVFYILLISSFAYGLYFYNRFERHSESLHQNYFPPDDD